MSLVPLVLSLLFLAIPTICMGATFPVATRSMARPNSTSGSDVGALYFVNTLGSVLGCLATAFALAGEFGARGTTLLAVGVDFSIAVAAFALTHFEPQRQESA